MSRCLSITEAAKYCGVSETAFRAHVEPHVPPIRLGKRTLWDRVALDRWLDEKSGVASGGDDFENWEASQGV